jgi:predicted metallo-beta-lactamase superfamily hydrolase
VDLGASIAPKRYGLPPHPLELERLERSRERALKWLRESHVVIITHYHYDHYMPSEPEAYAGKMLLVKHPLQDINFSQRKRSHIFLKKTGLEDRASVHYADSRIFEIGPLRIEFSKPVWHGEPGTKLGKLVMARIECEGESMVFASDVQGPSDPSALDKLLECARRGIDYLVIAGPPTYFAGFKVPVRSVEEGLRGLLSLVEGRPRTMVVDHHLLRDINYLNRLREHLDAASRLGVRLVTAAEYMGVPVEQLEARRRELWGREPTEDSSP